MKDELNKIRMFVCKNREAVEVAASQMAMALILLVVMGLLPQPASIMESRRERQRSEVAVSGREMGEMPVYKSTGKCGIACIEPMSAEELDLFCRDFLSR